jgi:hypothetical protein
MDQLALSLLEFPPPSGTYDDAIYHKAAKAHCQKVEKLMTSSSFKDFAPRLLDVGRLFLEPIAATADKRSSMSIQNTTPSRT